MKKVLTCCITVTAVACSSQPSDEAKIAELERRCADQAREEVVAEVSIESIGIHHMLFEAPVGAAQLPVLDFKYSPSYLAEKLLTGPDAIKEVRYTYEVAASAAVDPKCVGRFALVATRPEDIRKKFPCTSRQPVDTSFSDRYLIEYVYGAPDKFDIRTFDFRVVDTVDRKVLGSQRSLQLLLGKLVEKEPLALLGWGSAQGAKTCKLTPPDIFVKRVTMHRNPG